MHWLEFKRINSIRVRIGKNYAISCFYWNGTVWTAEPDYWFKITLRLLSGLKVYKNGTYLLADIYVCISRYKKWIIAGDKINLVGPIDNIHDIIGNWIWFSIAQIIVNFVLMVLKAFWLNEVLS